MPPLEILFYSFIAAIVYMSLLWIASLIKKDASIVDIFWGLGFVVLGFIYFVLSIESFADRKTLLLILVGLWGLRLSYHLARRNWGRGEDPRYHAWRKQHGASWWWKSFFQVFMLQCLLMWIISLPLLAAQYPDTPLNILDWIGMIVWGVGFFFEAVGDWQLQDFKSDPANKGKVMDRGLWRYTRHPNYFGDAAVWWGHFLIAAAASAYGWITLFSPLLMTFLLMRVSGVTLLEQNMKTRPGYQEYIGRTSPFFPTMPKKNR